MQEAVRDKLDHLPTEPGVYLMKNREGEIVYVGKAINLRSRVRSYFTRGDDRAFVALLDEILGDIEVIVVRNEKEALLLESELIKKHKPRYNMQLRDDKSFICLRLDQTAAWPRLEIIRSAQLQRKKGQPRVIPTGIAHDRAHYFGPYSSATSIRETLRLIHRHFRIRNCSDSQMEDCRRKKRPCLQYQIGRCPGPCIQAITEEEYCQNVQEVILFLKGKEATVLERIHQRMNEASDKLEFELAARFRDQIRAIENSLERQRTVSAEDIDRDVVGFYREADRLVVYLLFIRSGRLLGGRTFPSNGQEFPIEELLSSFVDLYYNGDTLLPDEILLPVELEDAQACETWLSEKRGQKVRVLTPKRGAKAELVELANKNAETSFHENRHSKEELAAMLGRLQKSLGLSRLPHTTECFDISLFQGNSAVGSKVRFLDGEPDKAGYRRFRIKTVKGTDDFAMLYEVLRRRIAQGDLPDLLVIDGGKGQLASAAAALQDANVRADLVSLAKSRVLAGKMTEPVKRSLERVFVLGRKDPVLLPPDSPELFLLQRLRDEAHRFAIRYHRLLRNRRTLHSLLEDIPGVGSVRRKALLSHFGSLKHLREANPLQISEVEGIGPSLAEQIYSALQEPAGDEL